MRVIVDKVRDAISPMRYGSSAEKGLYWFIRIASIAVPILLVLAVAGLIYAKANGIEIKF